MYWMLSLVAGLGGTCESARHAQSAPNNFLGLHLHDTQFYRGVGAWMRPDLHAAWAHGNLLLWHAARYSPMLTGSDGRNSSFWDHWLGRGVLPDNMGSSWVASSQCDQLVNLIDGAWDLWSKSGNATYLALAYELFRDTLAPADGNISNVSHGAQRTNWHGGGKQVLRAPPPISL